eukprot:SAG11_NODE_23336_length_390_cov_2.096220_1_plen_22_part_01
MHQFSLQAPDPNHIHKAHIDES